MKKYTITLIALLSFLCLPTIAQDEPSAPTDGQTPDSYRQQLVLAALEKKKSDTKKDGPSQVAATPTTAGAVSGFGERVNDSVADFLPLFQFAVNAVSTSDDGKSVTIKANPLKGRLGNLSFEATLVEPEISKALLDGIVEPARATQKEMLLEQTTDSDDIIWAVSYGYKKNTEVEWGKTRRLWGRDYATYEDLVDQLLESSWDSAPIEVFVAATLQRRRAADAVATKIGDDFDPASTEFKEIRAKATAAEYEAYVAALDAYAKAVTSYNEKLDETKLDEIAILIDNQPQLVANFTYRDRDEFIGPSETAFVFRLEWGRRNFNKILKHYKKLSEAGEDVSIAAAYRKTLEETERFAKDRFSFTLNYKDIDAYMLTYDYEQTVTDPMTMMDTVIPRTAMVSLGGDREITGALQWTHTLNNQELEVAGKIVHPKLELALDYTNVDNEMVRNSRFTGRVSYVYPLTESVSLPLSLVFSDDPEFVRMAMPDHEFSAHAGLSYKIQRSGK